MLLQTRQPNLGQNPIPSPRIDILPDGPLGRAELACASHAAELDQLVEAALRVQVQAVALTRVDANAVDGAGRDVNQGARFGRLGAITQEEGEFAAKHVVHLVFFPVDARSDDEAGLEFDLEEAVEAAGLRAAREDRPGAVQAGEVLRLARVRAEGEQGRTRRGLREHLLRVRGVDEGVPEHRGLSVHLGQLVRQPGGSHHGADGLGRRRFVLGGRGGDADEELLEAGGQVEVEDVRVGLVDGEGMLRVARDGDEGAGRSCDPLGASAVERALPLDDIEAFILRVDMGDGPTASSGMNDLVQESKGVVRLDPRRHGLPEIPNLPIGRRVLGIGRKRFGDFDHGETRPTFPVLFKRTESVLAFRSFLEESAAV